MKYTLLATLLLLLSQAAWAQADKKAQAKEMFAKGRYDAALAIISANKQLSQEDQEARFLLAVCYYQLNRLKEALALLNELSPSGNAAYPECWLYLGKVYHAQHQFAEAGQHYKTYLKLLRSDHPHRKMVREDIRRCANGLERQFQPPVALVDNLGSLVNTAGDEFAPVLSPNFSDVLYFSSIRPGNIGGQRDQAGKKDERFGQFYSDMFSCRLTRGQWGELRPMHYLLNSPRHEVLLAFDKSGDVLYHFKGWALNQGEIVIDTFKAVEERTVSSTPFLSPMNPMEGDGDLFLYDNTRILFSSRRPGGYGGSDLYQSRWLNGRWTPAENLGPDINTPFDEVSPFLARDGRTLYFSTNHSGRSIGGLDVCKAFYVAETQRWTSPVNLGMPINSAGDDAHFRIATDGFTAYFASSRKDGYGQRDLYAAYFEDFLEEMEPPQAATPVPTAQVADYIPPPPAPSPRDDFEEVAPTQLASPVRFVFDQRTAALSSQQQAQLREALGILQQYPQVHLVVSVYAGGKEAIGARLFSGIQQAEKVGEAIQRQGISADRIYLRALAAQAPSGHPYVAELAFVHTYDLPIQGRVPVIGEGYAAAVSGLPVNGDLCYKVQIASSKGALNSTGLSNFPHPMVETTLDFDFYRYTLGAFDSFRAAASFRQNLLAAGFSGAYIVPFIHGVRADKTAVKRQVDIFPDLQLYLAQ